LAAEPDQSYEIGTLHLEGALCGSDDVDVIPVHGERLEAAVQDFIMTCADPIQLEFGWSDGGSEPTLGAPFTCGGENGIHYENNTYRSVDGVEALYVARFTRPPGSTGNLGYTIDAFWPPPDEP
jgi:hypothetical protein